MIVNFNEPYNYFPGQEYSSYDKVDATRFLISGWIGTGGSRIDLIEIIGTSISVLSSLNVATLEADVKMLSATRFVVFGRESASTMDFKVLLCSLDGNSMSIISTTILPNSVYGSRTEIGVLNENNFIISYSEGSTITNPFTVYYRCLISYDNVIAYPSTTSDTYVSDMIKISDYKFIALETTNGKDYYCTVISVDNNTYVISQTRHFIFSVPQETGSAVWNVWLPSMCVLDDSTIAIAYVKEWFEWDPIIKWRYDGFVMS